MTGVDAKVVTKARTPAYVPVLFIALAVLAAQTARAHNDLKQYKEETEKKIEEMAARVEKYRSSLLTQGPLSIAERFSQRVTAHPVVLKKRTLAFEDLLHELKATTAEIVTSIEGTAEKDASANEEAAVAAEGIVVA